MSEAREIRLSITKSSASAPWFVVGSIVLGDHVVSSTTRSLRSGKNVPLEDDLLSVLSGVVRDLAVERSTEPLAQAYDTEPLF